MIAAYIVTGLFILFDLVTGFIKALHAKNVNSTILREGLFHKLSEILAIAGSVLLEQGGKYVGDISIPIVKGVCVYICIMEFTSIVENICEINPRLCKMFKPYLIKLQKGEETNGKSGN